MAHSPGPPAATAPVPRPASWLTDPLDDALLRYWDGHRWTFHTVERPTVTPLQPSARVGAVEPPSPSAGLRPDIAAALERVRGDLFGSKKEVNLLAGYLRQDERVLALTTAIGAGAGVLACTDRRLLFLFVGLFRRQFLQVNWNDAKGIYYDQSTKAFAVYTTKRTRRAVPAMMVRISNLEDAQTVGYAAQNAAAAPRLDIV